MYMKDYLMLVIAAILLAFDFALSKLYQKRAGTSLKAGFFFNALLGFFTALIFWGMNGFAFHVSPFSLAMAVMISVIGMSYSFFGFRILKSGSMALYTLFLMVGGMVIPYVWGLLFLDEPFSILRTVGLALLIFAVACSNLPQKGHRIGRTVLLMCITVFFLNGFVSVFSKLHQIEATQPTVNTTEFVLLTGIIKFFLAGIAYTVLSLRDRKSGKEEVLKPRLLQVLPLIVLSTVLSGGSYLLQLTGAANLPATLLYPFITGGSIIFSAIVGVIAFREKLSRNLILSIALCFIGTLLLL